MTECSRCKKKFERPLEDFSGRWHCPGCLHELFPTEETELTITAESREYFVRSERLFKQGWLLKRDVNGFSPQDALKECVRQCRVAASMNDPYALVSLANHYEMGYAEHHTSEVKCWNMAVLCNRAVALNLSPFKIVTDAKTVNLPDADYDAVRMEAAVNLLRLFRNVPAVIASSGKTVALIRDLEPKLERVCQDAVKVKSVLPTSSVYVEYITMKRNKREKTDARAYTAKDFLAALSGMSSQYRPPVFFLSYMSGAEVLKLADGMVDTPKSKKKFDKYCRDYKISLVMAEARNENETKELFENFFSVIENVDPQRSYFVFAFNAEAKTEKLSSKYLLKMYRIMMDESQSKLLTLVLINAYNDYVFCEDDIRIYLAQTPGATIERLIEKVKEI